MTTEVMLFVLLVFLMIGLSFTVIVDSYLRKEHRVVMLVIIGLVLSLIAQDNLGYRFDLAGTQPFGRIVTSIFAYSVRPVILVLFGYIVGGKRKVKALWVLAGINAAIHLTALFSDICFTIDAANTFHRGPLGFSSHIFSTILLAWLLFLSVAENRHAKGLEAFIPLANAMVVIAAVLVDTFLMAQTGPIPWVEAAMVLATLFYYIWLHLQFVRAHEAAIVEGQRVQLMLSQIKPHFLYNTLNAIEALCEEDPQMAKTATNMFSRYLRGNMDSIDKKEAIPFSQELEHTKTYLEIEKLRFEDALQIRYDIACTNFRIPALTVEPLVENAVRHGVRRNKGGRGTVTIAARETPEHFEVIISDDGPGFDPSHMPDDGKSHVGIANVRERLAQVCNGSLEIRSAPDDGTKATIILPKEEEDA